MAMLVHKLVLGMIGTNVYILENTGTKECLIIDPADSADTIAAFCAQKGLTPRGILLTHGHCDHILAADALKEKLKTKLYALDREKDLLSDPSRNCSMTFGCMVTASPDEFFCDLETRDMAGFHFQVLGTPGHTAGGCCYYFPSDNALFSGDTLFKESFGRTDFPTGNMNQLYQSVTMLLASLPGNTVVYPGHMEETTIEFEQKYNPMA